MCASSGSGCQASAATFSWCVPSWFPHCPNVKVDQAVASLTCCASTRLELSASSSHHGVSRPRPLTATLVAASRRCAGWSVSTPNMSGLTCKGPSRRRIAVTGGAGVPKRCLFQFFEHKVVCCGFWFSLFLPVRHQSLRLSQTNNITERQYARIHSAASDTLPVTCKWRYGCRFWALHGVSGVPSVCARLLIASVCRTFLVGRG